MPVTKALARRLNSCALSVWQCLAVPLRTDFHSAAGPKLLIQIFFLSISRLYGARALKTCIWLFIFAFLFAANASASYLPVGSGGNIGIGTTIASEKLEVIGTVKATGFIGDGSGLTGINNSQWITTGSDIYYITGNVGIGTTSPRSTSKLDIQGGPAAPSQILNVNGTFADLAGTRTGLYVDVTAGTSGGGGPVGSWSEVRTTANSGTYANAITGAYGEAQHSGNATADTLIGMMAIANQYGSGNVTNAYGFYPQVWKGDGTLTNAYGFYFQGVPNVNPDTASGAGTVVNQYGIAINKLIMGTTRNIALLLDDNVTGAAATGNFGIYEEAGNPNFFTGNIGIGTTAPSGQLALYSTANANLVDVHEVTDTTGAYANESQYKVGQAGANRATPADVQNFRFFSGYGSFQEVVKVAVNTPAVNAGTVTGAMDFYTQSTGGLLKRMTINDLGAVFQNGNVGVGSSVPAYKVDVLGTVKATAFIGDGSGLTGISGAISGLNTGYLPKASSATTINDSAIYQTAANIGIGTTAPSAKLDLMGAGSTSATSAFIVRNSSGTPGLTVLDNGHVGIGTADATYALAVNGGGYALIAHGSYSDFTDGTRTVEIYTGASGPYIGSYNNASFSLITNGTDRVAASNTGNVGIGGTITDQNLLTGAQMVVQAPGNVGISSTAPQAKLDVEGTSYFGNGNIGVGSAVPSQKVDVLGTVKATAFIGDGAGLTGIAGLTQWSNGAASAIYYNSGNVGIGSSAPSYKLDVNGSINSTGNISIPDGNKIFALGAGNLYLGPDWSDNIIHIGNTAGSTTILQGAGGKVGIGSTAPQTKLDVEGNLYVGNGNIGIGTSSPVSQIQVAGSPAASATQSLALIGNTAIAGGSSDGTYLGINVPDHFNGDFLNFQMNGNAMFKLASWDGRAVMTLSGRNNNAPGIDFDPPAGGSSYLKLERGNLNITDGTNSFVSFVASAENVGIGSTAPQARLDVEGSAYFGNGNIGIGSSAPSQKVDVLGTVKATAFIGDGAGLTGIAGLTQWSNGAASAIYYNSGNVGIGTSSPNNKLSVSGNISLVNDNTQLQQGGGYGGNALKIVTPSGYLAIGPQNTGFAHFETDIADFYFNSRITLGSGQLSSFTGTDLILKTGSSGAGGPNFGGTERLRILDSNGNTGIGSSVPQAKLDVEGGAYFGNGNVGIGSANTTSSLEIKPPAGRIALKIIDPAGGTVRFSTNNDASDIWDNYNSQWILRNIFRSSQISIGNTINADIRITPATNTLFTAGNVGINSTVPQAKLDVEGGAYFGNGNVGIGSASPVFDLDMVGTTGFRHTYPGNLGFMYWNGFSVMRLASGVGSVNLELDSNSAANPVGIIAGVNGSQIRLGDQAATTLTIDTASKSVGIGSTGPQAKLDVEGSAYFGNGNIGVGSAAPSQKIDVLGTVRATAFIGDGSGISGISGVIGGLGTGYISKASSATTINDSLIFQSAGGNIGIASTGPQAKLDVEGSAYFGNGNIGIGSSAPVSVFNINAASTTTNVAQIDAASLTSGKALAINGPNGGTVGVTSPLVAFKSNLGITGSSNGMINSDATINSSSNAPTQHMYVNTTNSPTVQNQVAGIYSYLTDGTALGNQDTGIATHLSLSGNATKTAYGISSSVDDNSATADTSYGEYINMNITGAVTSGTQSTYGIYATASSRSVNGGTANVYGVYSMPVGNVTSGTINAYGFYAANGFLASGGTSTKYGLYIAPQSGYAFNYGAYIGSSVGIGSSAPTQALDVLGTVKATAFLGDGSGLTNVTGAISGLNVGYLPKAMSSTNINDSAIYQSAGGNIGIGSTAPQGKLDVEGNVYVGNGNVGIGTAVPGFALEVAGTIRATGSLRTNSYLYTDNIGGITNGNIHFYPTQSSVGAGSSGVIIDYGSTYAFTSGTGQGMSIIPTFAPTSGTAAFNGLGITDIINQTGGANGITRGLYVSPTLTAAVDFRAIETVVGNVILGSTSGNVGVNSTAPQAKLDVEGNVYIGNGNVGIGTSVPASAVHVKSNTPEVRIDTPSGSGFDSLLSLYDQGNFRWSVTNKATSGNLLAFTSNSVANIMDITQAGNVGVGSVAPTQKVEVVGTVKATAFLGDGSGLTSIIGAISGLNVGYLPKAISATNINDSAVYQSGTNIGIGSTAPQGKLDVEGNIYIGNGNVGLGTSAPSSQLNIVANTTSTVYPLRLDAASGSANAFGMIINRTTGNGSTEINFWDSGNPEWRLAEEGSSHNFTIQDTRSGSVMLRIADSQPPTPILTLNSSFNVGISTSAPQGKLDVEGNVYVGNGNVGIGTASMVTKLDLYGTHVSGIGLARLSSTNDAVMQLNAAYGYQSAYSLGYQGVTHWWLEEMGAPTPDFTIVGSSGRPLTILDSNGYVGISSSAPQARLDVEGNSYFGNGNVGIGSSSPMARLVLIGAGTTSATNSLMVRDSAFAAKVTFQDNGNVGIGSTAPGYLLDVVGGNGIRTDQSISGGGFYTNQGIVAHGYFYNSVSNGGMLPGQTPGTYSTKIFAGAGGNVVLNTGAGDLLTATSGGNIGIGTSVPVQILDVEGNVYFGTGNVGIGSTAPMTKLTVVGNIQAGAGTTNNYYSVQAAYFKGTVGNNSSVILMPGAYGGDIIFGDYNTTTLNIMKGLTGYLGLGSSSPQALLDVEGNVYFGTGNVGIGSSSPMAKLVLIGAGTTSATNALMIRDSSFAAKVTVRDNGNVGIGTTAPAGLLEVKGQYFSTQNTTTTTLDWKSGNVQYIQLASGAQTFTFANPQGGARYLLVVKQPSSGAAGTVTWPAEVLWPGGASPILTGTNNKTDVITFIYDSTNNKYYAGSSLNY